MPQPAQEYVSRKELATKLNCSYMTIIRMEKSGKLKRNYLNGAIRYQWNNVLEALGKKKERT